MSITFGNTGAPSDVTIYLDAVFSTSLAYHNKKLVDNIGASNAYLNTLLKSDAYQSYEGGTDIRENLMYELSELDWYDGYDELPLIPIDGLTEAVFEARQSAAPVQYNMKEVINNRQKIISLVDAKLQQLEMGVAEGFAQAFMWGAGTSALRTPKSGISGALGIEPISSLIDYTPTTSRTVGNINQSTSSWWRNWAATSTATTKEALLLEILDMYLKTSRGMGGPPDLLLTDEKTFQLVGTILWDKYRLLQSDPKFDFMNYVLPIGNGRTKIVCDEKTPDVANGLTNCDTKGTIFFLNTKFGKLRYIPDRDFKMLLNENGKSFVKPPRGDSRLGHMAWMGASTISNRRKFGVIGSITRSALT